MTMPYMAWPQEEAGTWNYSYQVTRMIGMADFGATDFTEIHEAVQRISYDDQASWYTEWHVLGELAEKQAREAEAHGNPLNARFGYLRASNYYRASQFYLGAGDAEKIPALRRSEDLFWEANRYFEHRCEPVEIPYQGKTLPGYFLPSVWGEGPRPVIFFLCGMDALPEEMYSWACEPAAMAGYHAFILRQPGTGLTLFETGLPARYDSEAWVRLGVDYLLTRPEVDPNRIILNGGSFSGYLAPRAAAFEPRIAALTLWGVGYDMTPTSEYTRRSWTPDITWTHGESTFGYQNMTPEEIAADEAKWTLEGLLHQITCPVFCIVPVLDFVERAISQAVRFMEEVGSAEKKLVVIERGEGLGGVLHCNLDNLHVLHAPTFNWLNDVLDYRPGFNVGRSPTV
jgi:hypothetical protein